MDADDTGVAEGGVGTDSGTDAAATAATRWAFSFSKSSGGASPFLAAAPDGSIAIAGNYTGQPTLGTTTLPAATPNLGIYVALLAPNGALVWAKGWNNPPVGAATAVTFGGVAIGDDDRVYLAGDGANFSFGAGGAVPAAPSSDARHGFVVRFGAADGAVDGITVLTAQSGSRAQSLKVARRADRMVVTGLFSGTVALDGASTTATAACGPIICGLFAAAFDGATPALTWATSGIVANPQGGGADMHGVALDDDIVVAASFSGTSVSWNGTATATPVGNPPAENVLVVKLANNGGLVWATAYGDPSTSSQDPPQGAQPNTVAIAKDKTVFIGGNYLKRIKLGSTTLTAPPPSSGAQRTDGFIAALSGPTGDALWARAVSGPEAEDVPSMLAFPDGDVVAAARYQSGGIVVDGKGLANPVAGGVGVALLRYTTAGTLVSAISSNGIQGGSGPKIALLPNDGIAIGLNATGTVQLGPWSAQSDTNGTEPSMIYAGISP